MNRWLITALAFSLFPTPGDTVRSVNKSELTGEWAVVVWDFRGEWLTAPKNFVGEHYRDLRVTFTADRMAVKPRPGGRDFWGGFRWDEAYTIDPTKEPKAIDLPEGGRQGIYELHGDRLVICIHRSAPRKRPTRFEVKPGALEGPDTILLLERVKK